MSNLYLVTKTHAPGYDEMAGYVVRARDADDALQIAIDDECGFDPFTKNNGKAIELKQIGKRGIILSDFNAG